MTPGLPPHSTRTDSSSPPATRGTGLPNSHRAVGRARRCTATLVAEVVRMAHNTELGRRGEALAADHLEARGMVVLGRNWRCRLGEIDLIARDGDATVFIEVKTRSGSRYGHPFEAITPLKLARMRRLAVAWCESSEAVVGRIRLDAIAVLAPDTGSASIEHLEGLG